MKRALTVAILTCLIGGSAEAYVVNGQKWFPADLPVPFAFNGAYDEPGVLGWTERDEVRTSFLNWEGLTDSNITFTEGPTVVTNCAGTALALDGTNFITFRDPCGELGAGSLAMTVVWYVPGDTMVTNGMTFAHIVEADMIFSGKHAFLSSAGAGSAVCATGSYYDIQGVAAHEIGHFIGLGNSYATAATMASTLAPCDTKNVSLDSDDTAGAEFIYPQIDVLRAELSSIDPRPDLSSVFPLAPYVQGMSMPWAEPEAGLLDDKTRPLVFYQALPVATLFVTKSGGGIVLSKP